MLADFFHLKIFDFYAVFFLRFEAFQKRNTLAQKKAPVDIRWYHIDFSLLYPIFYS